MKNILTILFLIFSIYSSAQQSNTSNYIVSDTSKTVSFTTIFDETKMTSKDGYMINEYIVNISYNQAKKLNGKEIKITGHYTIIKGLTNQPKEYDKNGNEIFTQGRLNDIKRIEAPEIKIIEK